MAFLSGKEADNVFKYIGLEAEHYQNDILLRQQEYTMAMQMTLMPPIRKMWINDDLDKHEKNF